jgi:predicted nucleotidyltransferase
MLETLLGSKLRAKVLGWLFSHPDERYFVRQLTNLLGEDSTNVSRELVRLENTGILISQKEGKQKYYQANRKSPLFNELRGIAVKTVGIADVVHSALSREADKISAAFIFGSIADGTNKKTSDIDVMVVGQISFGETVTLLSSVEEKLGREINPVVYSVSEFRKRVKDGDHFISNLLESEKIFLIGDENEFGRLVE